jgi:hypothetical protein
MKIVFSMGEVFQEVKFWRWLMNIRTLKVLVFRQFFLYLIFYYGKNWRMPLYRAFHLENTSL